MALSKPYEIIQRLSGWEMLIILKDFFSNSSFKNQGVKLFAGNWFICKENIFLRYTFFSFFLNDLGFFVILKKCAALTKT